MKTSNVKRILCGCLLFAATWPAFSQPATNPRLIIRADDMGSFRSANIACMEGYKNGGGDLYRGYGCHLVVPRGRPTVEGEPGG